MKVATVAEYKDGIESLPFRECLAALRTVILEEAPDAVECISYDIPTYKFGRTAVHMAAFSKHLSFFPGAIVEDFLAELEGFKVSKGTIQFTPDRPIPHDLVRRIVRARREQSAK